MKKIVYTGVAALLIGVCSLDIQAQTTTTTNVNKDGQTGKVKIEMTIVNDDGEVEHINEEYDLSEISEEEIMAKLKKVEGLDIDMDDDNVKVIVKKRFAGENGEDLRFEKKCEMKKVAFLGVTGYTTNADGEGPKEVRLMKVIKDKPAYTAGLRNEDVLISFDGKKVSTYEELVEAIHAKKPNDAVKVKVRRDGKVKQFEVTLGEHEVPAGGKMMVHRFDGDNHFEFVEVDIEMESLNEADKALIKKSTGLEVNDANSMNDADLDVFPNPGDGAFSYTLKVPSGGELEVTVLEQTGKKIMKQVLKNDDGVYKGTLDLKKSPKGTYLLLFKKGDKMLSEKLIKS